MNIYFSKKMIVVISSDVKYSYKSHFIVKINLQNNPMRKKPVLEFFFKVEVDF
jgi:hypothetical protein